jgi:mono/diheme cytochrome c family protein
VSVVRGQGAFMSICRACHGEGGPAPSLAGVSKRLSHEQLTEQVRSPRKLANGGAASMPAFDIATLSQEDLLDLLAYLDRI